MSRAQEMTLKIGISKTIRIIRKHLWPYDASLATYVHTAQAHTVVQIRRLRSYALTLHQTAVQNIKHVTPTIGRNDCRGSAPSSPNMTVCLFKNCRPLSYPYLF